LQYNPASRGDASTLEAILMADPVSTRQNVLKTVRLIHGIMLALVLVYALIGERLGPRQLGSSPNGQGLFLVVISFVAVLDALIALYFREKFVSAAAAKLRVQEDDAAALKRWRSGSVTVSVLCLTIALYGFALRFLGFRLSQSLPFYGVAAALLLLWWPRLD
jgi:hypothetical protein